ncbi:formylglycine-generating enzyme family protein [Streptomyces sp. NBC_00320]|uniref:SUMF1/EgtB/PvdO family nonheme iron enzyme n=1 Tax=Streptomyces sp. NBC_00320 TaxID=2975711 RepID=UPI00224D88AD|nr:SUMF1/EgtB/PvdO family nonheme iron enzyme [Streptomyces sp. NBC_00320]MCX5151671.1 formylglycine-generating enzyme family protein [Streptomyces sp. NBC_00320]
MAAPSLIRAPGCCSQYAAGIADLLTPRRPPGEGRAGRHERCLEDTALGEPAVHGSWNDALAYCAWSGTRLPTGADESTRSAITGSSAWSRTAARPTGRTRQSWQRFRQGREIAVATCSACCRSARCASGPELRGFRASAAGSVSPWRRRSS